MKHKADGLYYVTRNMLAKVNACAIGRAQAVPNKGASEPLPITLKEARRLGDFPRSRLTWAAIILHSSGRITDAEIAVYRNQRDHISRFSAQRRQPMQQAQAFMDLLHARAKREGLVK